MPVGLASHSVPLGPAGPPAPGVKTSPEPPSSPSEPAAPAALPSPEVVVVVSSALSMAPPMAGTAATPMSRAAATARWVGRGRGIRAGWAADRRNDAGSVAGMPRVAAGRVVRPVERAGACASVREDMLAARSGADAVPSSPSGVDAAAAAGTAVSEIIGSHWRRARANEAAVDASSPGATRAGTAPRATEAAAGAEPTRWAPVASVLVRLANRSPTRGTEITGTSNRALAASTSDGAAAAPPRSRIIRSGAPSSSERDTAVPRMSS